MRYEIRIVQIKIYPINMGFTLKKFAYIMLWKLFPFVQGSFQAGSGKDIQHNSISNSSAHDLYA
jgi:hypothetical protein